MGIMMMNNNDDLNTTMNSGAAFSEGSLDAAMTGTSHPADPNFNISLMTPLGSVAFMGLGAPEMMSTCSLTPRTPRCSLVRTPTATSP